MKAAIDNRTWTPLLGSSVLQMIFLKRVSFVLRLFRLLQLLDIKIDLQNKNESPTDREV